jgi:predicted flap endonuclease-1-like 5' DNA nuclease
MSLTPESELHLTGTRVAEYFRFGCERQLRYELVPPALRGGAVPAPNDDPARGPLIGPRPGSGLLVAAGRAWERRKLHQLIRRLGAERVRVAGWSESGDPLRLPYEEVVALLREPGAITVLVQPELRLRDPGAFANRHGLDPARVEIAAAVPDLIRIRRLRDGRVRFQVVDIKGSATARLPHYAQVAFYTLVLDEVCRAEEIATGTPDPRWGRIWSRDGRGPRRFPLAAYRHHVRRVLREEVARVSAQEAAACAWHVGPRCAGCSFLEHCRGESDRTDDLARVIGVTATAKRVLADRGVRTVRQLAMSVRRETFQGCHALESQADRLGKRAQAVLWGKVVDLDARTHLMPRLEDVRVVLSAEGDPVTGLCFALGLRVAGRSAAEGGEETSVWMAEAGTAEAEGAMLDGLLDSLEGVLRGLDGAGKGRGPALHFYLYDHTELALLRGLVLRHLAGRESGEAVARLLRILSPRALSARPDLVRAAPGSVVADVVAALFALPVPYSYDLAGVSARLTPAGGGVAFSPPPGFGWPFSSQIAFERIHDVWSDRGFGARDAAEVRGEIERLIARKLAAIDSVIAAVRERAARRERLQLRPEPFRLVEPDPPLGDPLLERVRLFTELEAATEAVAVRALHILPAAERARRFESIGGLHLTERRDDGCLVFDFDEAGRDAKLRVGDFNLLLTNDDDRSLAELERQPWRRRPLTVELVEYDLAASPPRLVLAPSGDLARAEAEGWVDLDRVCVLDRAHSDFNTARILATLRALAEGRGEAATVLGLLRGEPPAGWRPPFSCAAAVRRELLGGAAARLGRPVLNPDQERAWRAVFRLPVSLIWGPPGTGKTYLLAWCLIGLAAAARREGRPLRVLVTAATHRATANVLARLAAELRGCDPSVAQLRAVKLRGSGSAADAELEGSAVEVVADGRLATLLAEAESTGTPLVVGSTVWSLWKQMRAAGGGTGEEEGGGEPVRPWFDVVMIDEASQMKVGESLIALSSLRPGGQVVLCGDDRQLSPVIHGSYGDEAGSLFGSVFTHFAGFVPKLPLRESRRMNAALVEYPRDLFYPGLVSMTPDRIIRLAGAAPEEAGDDALLRELFLAPEDAVVLCVYDGVRATARNPFEAGLAARLVNLARRSLLDPETGDLYSPQRFVADAFAVLSPHRAQNSAILAEMARLGLAAEERPIVDTVERMQGNEREMIVVSYGVADREYAESEAEFLLDANRFNVSVTRARAKLVVLVSQAVLDALPADEAVLTGSMALKGYVEHCSDAVRRVVMEGPAGEPIEVRIHYRRLAAPTETDPISRHDRAVGLLSPLPPPTPL